MQATGPPPLVPCPPLRRATKNPYFKSFPDSKDYGIGKLLTEDLHLLASKVFHAAIAFPEARCDYHLLLKHL